MTPSFFIPLVTCLLMLLAAQVTGQIVGVFEDADRDSEPVKNAAKFAVEEKFPGGDVTFEIIDALQQSVGGVLYDLTLDVIKSDSQLCTSHQYMVYQTFSGSYSLSESIDLGDC